MSKQEFGLNIHLYPSDFLHESRIEKISLALRDLSLFQSIWLVGILKDGLLERESLNEGVTLFRVGKPTMNQSFFGKMLAFFDYYRAVVGLIRREPVVCVNAHSLSVLPLAILIKFLKNCIVVYDTHELETETYSLSGLRQVFAKFVERIFVGRADIIFCVSDKISEWYEMTYHVPKPTTILNSPDFSGRIHSSFLRDRFNLSQSQRIFLYFGVLETGRGIELLLDAFNGASDNENVMVFVGYGSMVDTIVRSLAHGRNVFFLPAVPRHEIPMVAASADIGVCLVSPSCLSYAYCMPNKLFEYLTAGLPVLVSSCETLRDFVQHNQIGAVLENVSPSEVLDKISTFASLDLSEMKVRATEVARKHSWAVQVQKLKSVYLNIFNQHGDLNESSH